MKDCSMHSKNAKQEQIAKRKAEGMRKLSQAYTKALNDGSVRKVVACAR